jgi:hypothetical protein
MDAGAGSKARGGVALKSTHVPYEYAVAISFLSEDLPLARQIQAGLSAAVDRPVFVYPDHQGELTGKEFEAGLEPIFESRSELVIVLYRPGWGESGGTLVEWRAIERRRRHGRSDFLLPLLLDEGAKAPPWRDDIIHYDVGQYPLQRFIESVIARIGQPSAEAGAPDDRAHLRQLLRQRLVSGFTAAPGVYQGYFGGPGSNAESQRWQSERGESVDYASMPKLPYYHTYWAYEGATRIAADLVDRWRPVTLAAIDRHFANGRWLRAPRKYTFAKGPRGRAVIGETVRHTARAAEITALLSPAHPRISETVWELVRQANRLQSTDGGWIEFIGDARRGALWSTVYVFRLLSKVVADSTLVIDERDAFLSRVVPLMAKTEQFLESHWQEHRWLPNNEMKWDEGAAAVLVEVGSFVSGDLCREVYEALRATLTPAGRLAEPPSAPSAPSELLYSLRLAVGMKSAMRGLADADHRYQHLLHWLEQTFDVSTLESFDVGFAAILFDLKGSP